MRIEIEAMTNGYNLRGADGVGEYAPSLPVLARRVIETLRAYRWCKGLPLAECEIRFKEEAGDEWSRAVVNMDD